MIIPHTQGFTFIFYASTFISHLTIDPVNSDLIETIVSLLNNFKITYLSFSNYNSI